MQIVSNCVSNFQAYNRFAEGIDNQDYNNYLDLPLVQEEGILNEYKKLLNMS